MHRVPEVAMVALTAAVVTVISLGVALAARRGGRDVPSAGRIGRRVAIGMIGWLAVVGLLASAGVFAQWSPPRWPVLPIAVITIAILVSRTATARTVLATTPRHWLIAIQSFRVLVELVIYGWFLTGRAPQQITFEGRNFDILVGLSAPIVAWLVATGRGGKRLAVAWNVIGLAILANTVATVVSSTPGPFYAGWSAAPFTAIATWPVIWLPAFLAPLAVFFHISSLRQHLGASASRGG